MGTRLDRDALVAKAMAQSGLEDLGDVPFEEPLEVLLASWGRDARLDENGERAAENLVLGMLAKRLQLVGDRKLHPAIAEEKIVAPVFIVGLPRTGSTHLHALMALIEGARTPRFWEMSQPSPPPRTETYLSDPRIGEIQRVVDGLGVDFQRLHVLSATRPEQCNGLMDWSFVNQAWTAMWEVTSYKEWLFDTDYSNAFEAHRRILQHLQWQVPGTWVLKYPKHMMALDALLRAYPDARFVWSHRDPGVVVPSALSLTSFYRSQNRSYDPMLFGREWALLEEICAHRGISVRDSTPGFEERCVDVYFGDLMADPHGELERICDLAGLTYSDRSRLQVQSFLDDNPRTKHGENRYSAETWGLSAEGLRRRFGFYIDRFNVPVERSEVET